MRFWRLIPVLLAAAAILPACNKDEAGIEENPDDSVRISYLGKGFDNARYGDIFQIEMPDNFVGNLGLQGIAFDDYFAFGSGTYIYGILPEGDYKFLVKEVNELGKETGVRYTKDIRVTDYISFGIDGKLSPQQDWVAEYLGRYADVSATGLPIKCDRLSSSGTGDAYYYHVICRPGSIKTEEELLKAFEKGAGLDDLQGGQGLLDWYKMIAPNFGYLAELDWILAKGGADVESGYMDYTLEDEAVGTFDVYTVEMLLNGHITGRYGKTTLEITGTPDIKASEAAANDTKAQMRKRKL